MIFKKINNSLEEMARIGSYDEVEVVVFTNDPGNIPHFHIRNISTRGEKFHSCIRLDKAEYFYHTGKEDTLNSGDRNDLVKFLSSKSKSKRFSEFTNWQVLLTMWNMNNSSVEIDEDAEMPNYILIN